MLQASDELHTDGRKNDSAFRFAEIGRSEPGERVVRFGVTILGRDG